MKRELVGSSEPRFSNLLTEKYRKKRKRIKASEANITYCILNKWLKEFRERC